MARRRSGRPRGEVAEICKALDHLSTMNGSKPDVIQLKRDCFQKLIRYMTQGIDMSAAFVPVTKCIALSKSDLPLKKMQYLYLRTTARQNRSVALLVVQMLLNDCKDLDPAIRGAALRAMTSLRVPELMDAVFMAVEAGLRDAHHYVREAAVIGVLKCWQLDRAGVRLRGLLGQVESLLVRDAAPQVVANCLYVLQQVGTLRVTQELVISLLNHIRSFSDWAQCFVLDIVSQYTPATEAERFDILEVLDFGLSHTNSAVVMGTAKLFLHYAAPFPEQNARVLDRVRDALSILVAGREPEVVYTILSNALILAQRYPHAFAPLYTDFYCQYQDPSYLKTVKIDMLVAVADRGNAYDIAEELSQYIRDTDEQLARSAIRAVAAVALKVPEVDGILDRLLLFLGFGKAYVTAETLVQLSLVLRRFTAAAEACVDAVMEVDPATLVGEPERAAFVWVLGEFGQRIQAAPYLLEAMVEGEDAPSTGDGSDATGFATETRGVKLALVTAVAKLFFKRPPETKRALGLVLAAAAADASIEVRDRAQFTLQLLRHDAQSAERVLCAVLPPVDAERAGDGLSAEARDTVFDELNTLSVVYRAPSTTFIGAVTGVPSAVEGEEEGTGDGGDMATGMAAAAGADEGLLLDLEDSVSEAGTEVRTTSQPSPAAQPSSEQDLLSLVGGLDYASPNMPTAASPPITAPSGNPLDDLLDMGGGSTAVAQSSVQTSPGHVADLGDLLGGLDLGSQQATMQQPTSTSSPTPLPVSDAASFESAWASLGSEASVSGRQSLPLGALSAVQGHGFQDFVDHVGQAGFVAVNRPIAGASPPLLFQLSTVRNVLASVRLTLQGSAVAAEVQVRATIRAEAAEGLEALQNLLLCL